MISPVEKSIYVPLPPAEAFTLFTERMAQWWPIHSHSLSAHGDGQPSKDVIFEPRLGGRILETCSDGEVRPWATVTTWSPGVQFVLSWYVGRPETEATEVDVRFTTEGDGTRLLLTHSGFEALAEKGQETRDGYNGGWVGVLETHFLGACQSVS